MYRRNLYNNNIGNYFTFCAPEGFRPEGQPVNIIDVFNKYSNAEKKYIFTIKDTVETFTVSDGGSALFGYELGGLKYTVNYNFGDIVPMVGTKRYMIINDSQATGIAHIVDTSGKVGGIYAPAYEWLYCGKNIHQISAGTSGNNTASLKYVHLESNNQLEIIGYGAFYATKLTGTLNIPNGIVVIGNNGTEQGYGFTFRLCVNITKVIIPSTVNFIGFSSFGDIDYIQGGLPNVTGYYLYPSIAPSVPLSAFAAYPTPLHIKPGATGYDVAPWTDTAIFSQIIRDL